MTLDCLLRCNNQLGSSITTHLQHSPSMTGSLQETMVKGMIWVCINDMYAGVHLFLRIAGLDRKAPLEMRVGQHLAHEWLFLTLKNRPYNPNQAEI